MEFERRAIQELRTVEGRRLVGTVAPFNVEARIGDFTEVIRTGAFSSSLAGGRDILALVDHDRTRVLARTKSGNLKLAEDAKGLQFELSVPDTQPGRDVLELATRGDLGGMSFAFTVPKDGERWTGRRRELISVDLHEISVVSAWPAYTGTVVNPRTQTPRLNVAVRYLETLR
jgi:HK97 family phage prohead protease